MLAVDAYDHALTLFGPDAGVWSPADKTHVVGRWVPLAEVGAAKVGSFTLVAAPYVLRARAKAFQVLGEGASWAEAFNDATKRGTTWSR